MDAHSWLKNWDNNLPVESVRMAYFADDIIFESACQYLIFEFVRYIIENPFSTFQYNNSSSFAKSYWQVYLDRRNKYFSSREDIMNLNFPTEAIDSCWDTACGVYVYGTEILRNPDAGSTRDRWTKCRKVSSDKLLHAAFAYDYNDLPRG